MGQHFCPGGENLKTEKGIVKVYTLWIYCRAHIHGYYPHITLEEAMKHINGVLAWGNKDFHVELVPAKN